MLGLAGVLVMATADTKDVEATGSISYQSEDEAGVDASPATDRIADCSSLEMMRLIWSQEAFRQQEQAVLTSQAARAAEEAGKPKWVISISEEGYEALLKLVEAETSGEDVYGRMLVANVVLNRVRHPAFPNSVEEVVYQSKGGKAQFSPVATGKIDRVAVSPETVEAVERALCGEDESRGALYFVARAYASAENLYWFDHSLTWLFAYHGHEFYA